MGVLKILAIAAIVLPIVMTLLSFVRHPHWIFRVWDFPRIQIATLCLAGLALWSGLFFELTVTSAALIVSALLTIAWQLHRIITYTPLARRDTRDAVSPERDATFSLLMSNVLMENEEFERFIELVRERQPEIVLAVEIDERWNDAIRPLDALYPHRVKQPQNNYYGMVLLSKLPLEEPRVEFLVQDDIPSIHTDVRLPNGARFELHCIHPRPPEPLRNQRSTPRDAELVALAKQIEKKKDVPTIVAGDLNDVAWSETSQLFVRISGLLDPRAGRGLFNSYNANNPFFRFPLDHVFHSAHFELVELRRLPRIGSDHFPILITLAFNPDFAIEQKANEKKPGDDELATAKLEKEEEDAATGADRPNDD